MVSPNSNKALNIKENEILVQENTQPDGIVLLEQGRVDFKLPIPGNEKSEISYKKIFSVQGPAILGATSLLLNRPYEYRLIASTISSISKYQGSSEDIGKIILSKPSMVVLLLRSMLKETVEAYNKINTLYTASINLSKYMGSLGLAYLKVCPEELKKAQTNQNDPTLTFATETLQHMIKKGESMPDKITMEFLKEGYMTPEHQNAHQIHTSFDKNELNYLHRFCSLSPQILGAIAAKDIQLILMTAKKAGNIFLNLLKGLFDSIIHGEEIISMMLRGETSLLHKTNKSVKRKWDTSKGNQKESIINFTKFLWNVIQMLDKQYELLWSTKALEQVNQNDLGSFKQFLTTLDASPADLDPDGNVKVQTPVIDELKDMVQKVFAYGETSSEKSTEFNKLIKELKQFKNPLDTDAKVRKVRTKINSLFWEIYKASMLKHVKTKDKLPKYMKLFLNYGLLDETLLHPSQLSFLYNIDDSGNPKHPVYTAIQWCEKIYAKENTTSINELGLTFFELVKQSHRDSTWKRPTDLPPEIDTAEARLNFEIDNMLISTSKLTSGSVVSYLAPLSRYQITQSIDRTLVTASSLSQEIDKVLERDFSCFHREVLFQKQDMGILREFIQVQVISNFILVPSAGPIIQFWQEREGKDKMSPGRLIAPVLAMADVQKILLTVIGAYRWELVKTIMGPDWNNISQSSITADYTDYAQFFKKNRDLTPEMKEKIAIEFKRFRDDRSRFVNDYVTWVMYESEGTQRLNKIARKIMAKHVPFSKPYREKLLTLPSYTDLITKNINIRRRKANEMEPRFKKYRQMNDDQIPKELAETYNFYNMVY